jgi:hypothetical protein
MTKEYILYAIIYILCGYIAYLKDIRKQMKEMLNNLDYGSDDRYHKVYESNVRDLFNNGSYSLLLLFVLIWVVSVLQLIVNFILNILDKLIIFILKSIK